MGGPSSPGSASSSGGPRTKESDKQPPSTFFLGRYRVVDEIGVGGMASVHLARMDGPGGFQKWVAIKRIHPHLVEDDQFVDMFLDEARIAAGISHANVAQVFDLGKDDNTYWIAMEYLHGEPLREVMRRAEERRLRISPELAARICSDAAKGLHAAHELRGKNGQLLGLVHRDVTPHNLFLTYDGNTKVVDFGIAKVADRLSSTRAGTLKGKLAYMSPEQVRGAEVDRTTDIFALGVVLWELTTNQRLFRMDTDLDTLEKVQACIVPPPSSIVPDYPVELESVVMRALAKRKQDRYPTAQDFSDALEEFLVARRMHISAQKVAQFVKQVFADRIQKREAHLAWAAEVTSTVNVDQLRGLSAGPDESLLGGDPKRSRGPQPPQPPARPQQAPASGVAPIGRNAPAPQPEAAMAATSLMDDDEDVPTTVASREQLDGAPGPERLGPRPAAGMAPRGPAMSAQAQFPGASAQPAAFGSRPGPQQGPGGPAPFPTAQFPMPPGAGGDERTAAFPGGAEDLGATVALPGAPQRPLPDERSRHPGLAGPMGGPQPQGYPGAGFGPQPFNGQGQGYGPPPQPMYPGAAQPGFPPGGPMSAPTQAFPMPPGAQGGLQLQSQIETALSLPRPDPAALWLAQQDAAKRGQRKNTGVIIAVVALTALCIIGIGALVYFKMQAAPAQPVPSAAPAESAPSVGEAAPPATAAPTAEVAAAAPTASAAAATPTAAAPSTPPAGTIVPASAPVGTKPTGAAAAAPTAATGAEKEEPGFLTIVCNPQCDEVIDNGRSLGPSPIVHVTASPGQHRITLKRGSEKPKVISVIVVSGQVTAQRVTMK